MKSIHKHLRFFCSKCLYMDLLEYWFCRLLEHILSLPLDMSLPPDYAAEFNAKLHVSFP